MNKYLETSIAAFNVSRHCDRSSPQAFYDSYIARKQKILTGKLLAVEQGRPVNQDKLKWEIMVTELAVKEKDEFLKFADRLIKTSNETPSLDILERATKLLETPDEN